MRYDLICNALFDLVRRVHFLIVATLEIARWFALSIPACTQGVFRYQRWRWWTWMAASTSGQKELDCNSYIPRVWCHVVRLRRNRQLHVLLVSCKVLICTCLGRESILGDDYLKKKRKSSFTAEERSWHNSTNDDNIAIIWIIQKLSNLWTFLFCKMFSDTKAYTVAVRFIW